MTCIADRYRALVSERGFESDPAQAELVGKLDALADKLKGYKAGGESRAASRDCLARSPPSRRAAFTSMGRSAAARRC